MVNMDEVLNLLCRRGLHVEYVWAAAGSSREDRVRVASSEAAVVAHILYKKKRSNAGAMQEGRAATRCWK